MSNVIEQRFQYFDPSDTTSTCTIGRACEFTLTVPQDMTAPVYFMYEVGNFYQNHRGYIQSKSNYQLAGNIIANESLCYPYFNNSEFNVSTSWGGVALDPSAIASPCGAIARTFFNDTFQLFKTSDFSQVFIN